MSMNYNTMIGRQNTFLHVLAVGYMAVGNDDRNSRLVLGSTSQRGMASVSVASIKVSVNQSLVAASEKPYSYHIQAYKCLHSPGK